MPQLNAPEGGEPLGSTLEGGNCPPGSQEAEGKVQLQDVRAEGEPPVAARQAGGLDVRWGEVGEDSLQSGDGQQVRIWGPGRVHVQAGCLFGGTIRRLQWTSWAF